MAAAKLKHGSNPDNDVDQEVKQEHQSAARANELDQIEAWLQARFEFRFNTITDMPECRAVKTTDKWAPLSDYKLNSMVRDLKKSGYRASRDIVSQLMASDFSAMANPITDTLNAMKWDGKDHIADLAMTIQTAIEPSEWYGYLRRWLIATAANALTVEGCQNHTCLVLVGAQGKGKTTWFNKLIPDDMWPYYFVGQIDPTNKDTLAMIGRKFIINIDDYLDHIHRKAEYGALKELITRPEAEYRAPYDKFPIKKHRIASFCASVNNLQFLSDPTGNRRFLVFEALDIHQEKMETVNVMQVWAQAVALFKMKERYWFDRDEVASINERNSGYEAANKELSAVQSLFSLPGEGAMVGQYLTIADISVIVRDAYRFDPSEGKLGSSLQRAGFKREKKDIYGDGKRIWCYHVIQIDSSARQKAQMVQKEGNMDLF